MFWPGFSPPDQDFVTDPDPGYGFVTDPDPEFGNKRTHFLTFSNFLSVGLFRILADLDPSLAFVAYPELGLAFDANPDLSKRYVSDMVWIRNTAQVNDQSLKYVGPEEAV